MAAGVGGPVMEAARRAGAAGWFLVVGTVVAVGYYLLPRWGAGPTRGTALAQGLLFTAVSAAGGAAVVVAVVVRRPPRPLPWLLLALSQLSCVIADGIYYVQNRVQYTDVFPTLADPFYLLQYPLLGWALVIFVRRRTPGWHISTLIDAAVIAIGVGVLGWVYLIEPLTATPDVTFSAKVVSVAYPIMDLLVFAIAVRLVMGTGARPLTFYLLIASLLVMLVADVSYALQIESGRWRDGTGVDALWLVEYLLLGAAALHPCMRRLDERASVAPPEATVARLVALALACLAGPTALLIQYLRGAPTHIIMVALACAALSLLVLAHAGELIATQQRIAVVDALTGLYSRRHFTDVLRRRAERPFRARGSLGVLLVDADHFKRINDAYGHSAGDLVLCHLADRLRAACRPNDLVSRYGGEEFAILLIEADEAVASQVAERIRRVLATAPPTLVDGTAIDLTVSIGAAVASAEQTDVDEIVQSADRALYDAKRGGRDRMVPAWRLTQSGGA